MSRRVSESKNSRAAREIVGLRDQGEQTELKSDVSLEREVTVAEETTLDDGKEKGDDSDSGLPVDRGWAWVVCAGCFLVSFIMALYDHVLAVMFVDIVDRFQVSVTTAALVFTVNSICFSFGSIVSTNVLVPRFGDRIVIVSASMVNSLTTIVIAFSPNIVLYHCLHSLKGFSLGSMWVPSLGLLGHYFKRRRSLATALSNAGIGVSMLAVPPLVRALLDTFGFQGTLLLMSSIEMQAIAFGMLLRPVSCYFPRGVQNIHKSLEISNDADVCCSPSNNVKAISDGKTETLYYDLSHQKGCTFDTLPKPHCIIFDNQELEDSNKRYCENNCGYTEKYSLAQTWHSSDLVQTGKGVQYDPPNYTPQVSTEESDLVTEEQKLLRNSNCLNVDKTHVSAKYNQLKRYPDEDYGTSILQQKDDFAVSDRGGVSLCCRKSLDAMAAYFDIRLLGDWLIRILLVSTIWGALLIYIPIYIPTLAVKQGVDKTSAAKLLTICGGVNLVCLMLQGLIVDAGKISAVHYIVVAQVIVGTMCHLTHFFTSFPTLVLFCVVFGMFGGARMSLIPVVSMDFVGVADLGKVMGFNAMIATISLSLHHPFLGFLLETTGTFTVPFHYVGFGLYLSAAFMLLEPIGRKFNSRKVKRSSASSQ